MIPRLRIGNQTAIACAERMEPFEFALRHGFGAFEAPARAGDVHSIFDDVATCALDDAGGDRPAVGERGRVVEVPALCE